MNRRIAMSSVLMTMLLSIVLLLIVACGADPTATPRPTNTPAPEPTATPVPSEPGTTPRPTATPRPKPTATPVPEWKPTKDITWIVPFGPGGGYDFYSRAIANVLAAKYLPEGIKVVVKNTPGGGARVGLLNIYKKKPDGHTLGIVHVPGPALYQLEHGIEEAGYDITKLNWLGNFNIASNILVVGEKSPFRSLEDLQKAEVVKWAGSGPGTASYNMSLIVADKMKLNISHVTGYKGAVDYATGVARGDADIASSPPTTLLPFIESGQLIPLAVFGFDRLEIMPEVKTAQEQGFDITIEEVWPIAGPPGLPDDVLSYWEGIIAVALQDPDFIQLAKDAGRPLAPLSAKDATERVDRVFSDTVKILELTKK